MIENHGTRFLSAGEGPARTQLAFKPGLTQLTGLFHAGAIIALADETATAAAMWETNPTGELRPELFPLTLQLSINLIRNTNRGTLQVYVTYSLGVGLGVGVAYVPAVGTVQRWFIRQRGLASGLAVFGIGRTERRASGRPYTRERRE